MTATTSNGALAYKSSFNACLDFFYLAGNRQDATQSFITAYQQNRVLALLILFWSRDCRGGAGARITFINSMRYLQREEPYLFNSLLKWVPEFGYYKDLFKFKITHELINFIIENINDNLLTKYIPRKGPFFIAIKNRLGWTSKELRKHLVNNTHVVENQLCKREWHKINYEHVPSLAMNRYNNQFINHDYDRFIQFNNAVKEGKAKMHASQLFPHQVYQQFKKGTDDLVVENLWNNLAQYQCNNVLPICDVSGSMWGLPMDVSISLGVYLSQHNHGLFKDAFMTFSDNPKMNYLTGSITDRFKQLNKADWGFSTDLNKTFRIILEVATSNHLQEEDMPSNLLIISDMQFNASQSGDFPIKEIERDYRKVGYKMPKLIFWNVNGSAGSLPATMCDHVGLISGFSPAIIESVLDGEVDPIQIMENTVMKERYMRILK